MPQPYEPLHRVAQGATGDVWLAQGPAGQVALKRAGPGSSLLSEADALRAIQHPSVVRLLDADPGGRWMATEYAERGTCATFGVGRSLREILAFAAEVADGLAAIHAAGQIHGDLKPANVLVSASGAPRIVDLIGLTPRSPNHGTLGFVAPERLRGDPASMAADIYGFGTVFYTLLTGRAPFEGADASALAWLPLATIPEPPSALRPALPRAIDDLVLSLLSREPAQRPARAAALPALIWAVLRGSPRRPFVGMQRERAILRQAIVSLQDGVPAVIVVHGPRGSGRGSLIREAGRLARRQGLRVFDAVQPSLSDGTPTVLALDTFDAAHEQTLLDVLAERQSVLAIVRADRPIPRLADAGARHVAPSPLGPADISRLARCWGVASEMAPDLYAQTSGTPSAVIRRLAGYAGIPARLEPTELRILRELEGTSMTVDALAQRTQLPVHRLLDLVEPLCDQGLLVASADGARLTGPPRGK